MSSIMIVDDEKELLILYTEMIRLFGHDIVAALENGDEAINVFKQLDPKPDLIILDHRMPVRNGLETAMEIMGMDPDQKIIFISADGSVKRAAMDIGALEFLEKPFVLKTLKDAIERAIGH